MALDDDLRRIADVAASFADPDERVAAVLAAEPEAGGRVYLCAFAGPNERTSWIALDDAGAAVVERAVLRNTVSIAALCELAEETAAGGDLDELRSQLVALRLTENPPGIDEAEDAVVALQHAIGAPPRVANLAYLDDVGTAARRVEQALGDGGASPFAAAMKTAVGAVDALTTEVEANYKRPLA